MDGPPLAPTFRSGGNQLSFEQLEQLLGSKQVDQKLQGLEFLYSSGEAIHFVPQLLTLAKYPIRSVHELAFKTFLRWLPKKEPEPESDSQCFELLLFKIIPWVNEAGNRLNQSMSVTQDEQSVNTIDELKTQAGQCLDHLFTALPRDIVNQCILAALKYANFKVQVAGCQAVKQFYHSLNPDKTILELDTLCTALGENLVDGTKELKRQSLDCFASIHSVFGDDMEPFIDQLPLADEIHNAIKQHFSFNGAFDSVVNSPQGKPRKREESSQNTPAISSSGRAPGGIISLHNLKTSPMHSQNPSGVTPKQLLSSTNTNISPIKSTTTTNPALQGTPQPSNFTKSLITNSQLGHSGVSMSSQQPKESSVPNQASISPRLGTAATHAKSSLPTPQPPQPQFHRAPLNQANFPKGKYDFDEFKEEEASDALLAYDDKWCKKVQIMSKEDPILEELDTLGQLIQSSNKVQYFSEVNKSLLHVLKNFLMSKDLKRVSAATLPVIRDLFKRTTRTLQDAFPIFFPELIEKLKSKSKQDDIAIEALVYLSSNTNLTNFLRRIQKEFLDKNSTLRMNLIELLCQALQSKSNYDSHETMKAGPVLAELRKFAESELSKDLAIPVRKASEKVVHTIQELYAEEVLAASSSNEKEFVNNDLPGHLPKRVVGQSTGRKSSTPSLPDAKKPPSGTAEKTATLPRNNSNFNPTSSTTELITVPPSMITSRSTLALKSSTTDQQTTPVKGSMQPIIGVKTGQAKVPSIAGPLKSSGHNILNPQHSLQHSSSRTNSALFEIAPGWSFEASVDVLEKLNLDKRDQNGKNKLGEVIEILANKVKNEDAFDRLSMQLHRLKEEIPSEALINCINTIFGNLNYYPPSLIKNVLPQCLMWLESNSIKSQQRSTERNPQSENTLEVNESKPMIKLINSMAAYYGPPMIFEVFEDALYTKDLFQSKMAEELFILLEYFLVRFSPEYHPIPLILSLIRGFIYLNNSQAITLCLGELPTICSQVYGKDNFRYIKKEFELVGLKDKQINIKQIAKLEGIKQSDQMAKLVKMTFKDKIISEVKDQTAHVRSLLGVPGHSQQRSDPALLKDLLQICTRNFIYTLGEKENQKFVDFLGDKLIDSSQAIVRLSVQTLALHFNSAKTTFKFTPVFFANLSEAFRHTNPEIRGLSLNSAFYISKQEPKIFKLLIGSSTMDVHDDARIEVLGVVSKLLHSDKKYLQQFDVATNFDNIVDLLLNKRAALREEGEYLLRSLFHIGLDKKELLVLCPKIKNPSSRKSVIDAIERISEGKKLGPMTEDSTISHQKPKDRDSIQPTTPHVRSQPKSNPPSQPLPSEMAQKSASPTHHTKPSNETKPGYIVQNVDGFSDAIIKCRSVESIKTFVGKHLSQEICQLLFDPNSKNVLIGVHKLMEGLIVNPLLASKSFVFIFKLLNLLIEAEGKQNDVSKSMADILATMIKLRKSTHESLKKFEKWALCDFLLVLNKCNFEKKFLAAGSKLCLGLLQTAEEKSQFATLVERNDRKFYMMYMGSVPVTSIQDNSLFVKGAEIAIEEYEPEYEMLRPGSDDFIEDPNDENLIEFRNAMADESSIKYESGEPFMMEGGESPGMMIPSPKRDMRKKKADIKDNFSSSEEEGNRRKQSDDYRNNNFTSMAQKNDHEHSPRFGTQANQPPAQNTATPISNQASKQQQQQVQQKQVQQQQQVKGNFTIFPRSTSKPEMIGSPRGPAISDGGEIFPVKRSQGLVKNSSSKGFDTGSKNTAETGYIGQHKSDDNIFKRQGYGGKSLTNDSRQDAQSKSSHSLNLPNSGGVAPLEITSPEQACLIFSEGVVSSLAEAIVFLRDAADELNHEQTQLLLTSVSSFLEYSKPNERTIGSIIDMMQEVLNNADVTSLSLRELVRCVSFCLP
jgi:hypothetical protein